MILKTDPAYRITGLVPLHARRLWTKLWHATRLVEVLSIDAWVMPGENSRIRRGQQIYWQERHPADEGDWCWFVTREWVSTSSPNQGRNWSLYGLESPLGEHGVPTQDRIFNIWKLSRWDFHGTHAQNFLWCYHSHLLTGYPLSMDWFPFHCNTIWWNGRAWYYVTCEPIW